MRNGSTSWRWPASRPDFRTINQFRKRRLEALAGLFLQVLDLCRRAGLVPLALATD